jgi:hypothetical protein
LNCSPSMIAALLLGAGVGVVLFGRLNKANKITAAPTTATKTVPNITSRELALGDFSTDWSATSYSPSNLQWALHRLLYRIQQTGKLRRC